MCVCVCVCIYVLFAPFNVVWLFSERAFQKKHFCGVCTQKSISEKTSLHFFCIFFVLLL